MSASMTNEAKDVIYAISASGLLFGFPLLVLGWIGFDVWTASHSVDAKDAWEKTCSEKVTFEKQKRKRKATWLAAAWGIAVRVLAQVRSWGGALLRGLLAAMWVLATIVRIVAYAMVLLPWFVSIALRYLCSPRVLRGLRFGPNARNFLDIYLPDDLLHLADEGARQHAKLPVVVIAMGGAWTIGHRGYNAQVGFRLAEVGVMVVAVDYRNFPFARVGDMLQDIEKSVEWVFANIAGYGGDPQNVVLMGQSAGAHLQALVLLDKAIACSEESSSSSSSSSSPCFARAWAPRDLKGWVGVSGVYDTLALEAHLRKMGADSFLPLVMDGEDLAKHSPLCRLRKLPDAVWLPPAVRLFHGGADTTVPVSQTQRFAEELRATGVDTFVDIREGVTHSEPVVEDPFRGGDIQAGMVVPLFGPELARRLADLPPPRPQPPRLLVSIAEYLMPF